MSPAPSSSSSPSWPSISAFLVTTTLLLAVLTAVHSTTTTTSSSATATNRTSVINSRAKLRAFSSSLARELQQSETLLSHIRTNQSSLQRSYGQFTARTARHGWSSTGDRHHSGHQLLSNARRLQSNLVQLDHRFRTQFEPRLEQIQRGTLHRYRDSALDSQIAQSVKVYKRIIELLVNMIEVPVFIIEQLGVEGDYGEDSGVEQEEGEEEGHDYGEGDDGNGGDHAGGGAEGFR